MIEPNEQQRRAVQEHPGQAIPMVDPATKQAVVLIRRDLYDSLTDYDDGSWTDEEMDQLAVEVDAMLDDEMAIEDANTSRSMENEAGRRMIGKETR